MEKRISVLIPTYNRADILADTLLAISRLRPSVARTEWIVINNNCSDHTESVVHRFTDRLKIRYLVESRPGKNCALNRALGEKLDGDIIVFTDDDISPAPNWVNEIVAACDQNSDYSIFGGKIVPKWPANYVLPGWVEDPLIRSFAYAQHDLGIEPVEYGSGITPFGGNFWIRRHLLDRGFLYNEKVGPSPKNRVMGSETTFLEKLRSAGNRMLYYPGAVVEHRISPTELTRAALRQRALRFGRGEIHVCGMPSAALRKSAPGIWLARLIAKVMYASAGWGLAAGFGRGAWGTRMEVDYLRVLGNALEALRVRKWL